MNSNYIKDYYHILGVEPVSSHEEIKQAFRRLALQHHPDRNLQNQKQSEEKFKEINEAYQVLGNQENRRRYDYMLNLGRAGRFFRPGTATDSDMNSLGEEELSQLLHALAAFGFKFGGCGGYGRRCRRW